MNAAQKVQNPYFANPFFRPKMVTNQPAASSNGLTTSGPTRESSVVTTTIPFQTSTTSSMTNANSNRAKLSMYPQPMNAPAPINSRLTDSETTGLTTTSSSSNQDDPRRWAQTVGPASIARRALNDERPNGVLNLSSANVSDKRAVLPSKSPCSNRQRQPSAPTHRK